MLLCLAMLACSTPQAPADPHARPDPVAPAEVMAAGLVDAAPVDPGAVERPDDVLAAEPGAAVFVEDEPSPPAVCQASFTTNTRVSIPRGTVVIDHFDGRTRTERITVQLADIARLEHELHAVSSAPLASGEELRCSAIFLVLKDGRRLLFDDDPVADLEQRARRLAETMSLPLEVVRDDADGSAAR